VIGALIVFTAVVVAHEMIRSFGPVLGLGRLFAALGALMGGAVGFILGNTAAYPGPAAADAAWDYACQERLQRGDVGVAVSAHPKEAERAAVVLSPQRARELSRVS
jgi:hypothetical protein